jgi:hypothetical protein
MDWKQITIEDKAVFDRFLKRKGIELSDYSFTNFFIWHLGRCTFFAVVDDFLCVQIKPTGMGPIAMMPVGDGDVRNVIETLMLDFEQRKVPFRMRAISGEMKDVIEAGLPKRFSFAAERDRFDYVYDVQELIKLEGSKFKPKRNHLNMFKELYDGRYRYGPLTSEWLRAVVEAENAWCQKRNCQAQENLESEKKGIIEAVNHFDRLGFDGGVLTIDDQVVAFTFGEAITNDMVVIHIEKADPDVRGAYQMINQQFLEQRWPKMKFVNREEDLGIDGLRKAKESYNPSRMIEKYSMEPL